jgi:hypothetical protein
MALLALLVLATAESASTPPASVPIYRVFEFEVPNPHTTVANPFADVTLNTTFVTPSGDTIAVWGFFDGGKLWKQRFMASAVGHHSYSFSFSDGSLSGKGSFECVSKGGGPGILRAYKNNPHWFAYNGDTPVFLKSFYNKAGGLIRQDPSWAGSNFYSKIVDRGYNHHMSSGFMPVLPLTALWDGQVV